MLKFFERLLEPTEPPPDAPPPTLDSPHAVWRFYWHFVRQIPGPLAALFTTGFFVAITDARSRSSSAGSCPWSPRSSPRRSGTRPEAQLLLMAALFLVLRPAAHFAQFIVVNLMLVPGLTNLVRWQSHWHVVRQGWTFFQNDFAGRIAARVMQTGPALRESVVLSIIGIWYILVYGTSAVGLLAAADWRLSLPIVFWFGALCRVLARVSAADARALASHVGDALGPDRQDRRQLHQYPDRQAVRPRPRRGRSSCATRSTSTPRRGARSSASGRCGACACQVMNALLMVGTGALAILLWRAGYIGDRHGRDGDPDGVADHQHVGRGSRSRSPTSSTISARCRTACARSRSPRQMPDLPGAVELPRVTGAIRFEQSASTMAAHAGCGGVLRELDLDVAPGERVGLVGRSGAGKSTLVHLLLGFYRPERGRILIDGRDIAGLTQESLRAQIGMVTQDTSLLHRSIRDNIRYGRPDASEAEIVDAARRAHATRIHRGARGLARPHRASTRMSANAASSCRAASASASPSPG